MARLRGTIVHVDVTVAAAEAGYTDTPVSVDVIEARAAIDARRLRTFVNVQLTVIT